MPQESAPPRRGQLPLAAILVNRQDLKRTECLWQPVFRLDMEARANTLNDKLTA